jgi:citrate synthase
MLLKSKIHCTKLSTKSKISKRNKSDFSGMKKRLSEVMPKKLEEMKEVKTKYADRVLTECTVDMAYTGMRDIKSMVHEVSLLDAQEGIRFRGFSIPELQKLLPKQEGGSEPKPESILWLLMTGEVPREEDVKNLTRELSLRAHLPVHVAEMIDRFPKELHPMSQFSAAVVAMQRESLFAKAYENGLNKKFYWDPIYEDSMNLIAALPLITSRIYRNVYRDAEGYVKHNPDLDYSANFANMMGFRDPQFIELLRLYLVIHSDHEGGNASAHATHLTGSTLSDPYLSFASGLNALAGPLHGLANQEVLRWVKQLRATLGDNITAKDVEKYVHQTLDSGQVVPGFGHAVLRKTDPRYTCQREFALKHLPNDPLFKIVSLLYEIVPQVLSTKQKIKNPWPNVDAHSGCLLVHYGLVEENFYTVLFGVSRAMGVLSQLVWSRAAGLPLERPKSVTTEWIKKNFEN